MCNCVSESVNDIKKTNFFVKMLILSKGDDDNKDNFIQIKYPIKLMKQINK